MNKKEVFRIGDEDIIVHGGGIVFEDEDGDLEMEYHYGMEFRGDGKTSVAFVDLREDVDIWIDKDRIDNYAGHVHDLTDVHDRARFYESAILFHGAQNFGGLLMTEKELRERWDENE